MHVVMFSGGVGSWAAAKRIVAKHNDVVLLFTDTKIEDPDLYRFIDEAAADVGAPLVKIADGRTPWEVFRDERFLGNDRAAICSKLLKQKPARAWMLENAPKATVVLGIDWTEIHRLSGAERGWAPWTIDAPLCRAPYLDKIDMLKELERVGIRQPNLYTQGFAHNNCGGGCVRAGIASFKHLLSAKPDVYLTWENEENRMRAFLDKDVSILRDRRNGTSKPLTLGALRSTLQTSQNEFADEEWGGCGCFVLEEDVVGNLDI